MFRSWFDATMEQNVNRFEPFASSCNDHHNRDQRAARPQTLNARCSTPPSNSPPCNWFGDLHRKRVRKRFQDSTRENSLSMTWLRNEARMYHYAHRPHVERTHRRYPPNKKLGRLRRSTPSAFNRSNEHISCGSTISGQEFLQRMLSICSRRQERSLQSTTHSRFVHGLYHRNFLCDYTSHCVQWHSVLGVLSGPSNMPIFPTL